MVDREQVLHIARLAKLELSPEQETRFAAQLGKVLEYVEQLREIDGETAEELTHVAPVGPEPRPDEPKPGLSRDEVMKLAPKSDGETLQVPAAIDGGSSA